LQSEVKNLKLELKGLKKRTQVERKKTRDLESELSKLPECKTIVQKLQQEAVPTAIGKDTPWFKARAAEDAKRPPWFTRHVPVLPDQRIPFLGEKFGNLADDKRLSKDHDHMLFMGESPAIADGDFDSCKVVDFLVRAVLSIDFLVRAVLSIDFLVRAVLSKSGTFYSSADQFANRCACACTHLMMNLLCDVCGLNAPTHRHTDKLIPPVHA
jgi:hypothetical protein